jgi:ribonucleoside-triphosphate reductase (formate)
MTDTTEPTTEVKRVPCEVYSRIVGYLRPVQNWNDGKRQEFRDRRVYAQPTEEELR